MGVIRLPRLGETMEEARVVEWLRAPGEAFARGDVLLEVETDKTVVEVPALSDGVMGRHLVGPGETVTLGAPIAEVEGAEDAPADARPPEAEAPPDPTGRGAAAVAPADPPSAPPPGRVAASPRARRLAREGGLDLAAVPGTGRGGRVTGADVAGYGEGHGAGHGAPAGAPGAIHLRRLDPAGAARGAPLLLLHGLFDDGRGWRDLPRRLAEAGHPALVADLPGHGRSAPGDGTLEGAEAALAPVLPEGRVGLVGHSLGAVLAARLARRLGDRLDRLVLIAPAGLGPRIDAEFLDGMAEAATPAALARAYARLGPGAGPLSQAALGAEVARLAPRRAEMAALGRALARGGIQQADIAADLRAVEDRLTVILGLDDAVIDWRDAAALPPRARVHLLRGVGHLPQAVAPDLVAELILRGGLAGTGPP